MTEQRIYRVQNSLYEDANVNKPGTAQVGVAHKGWNMHGSGPFSGKSWPFQHKNCKNNAF